MTLLDPNAPTPPADPTPPVDPANQPTNPGAGGGLTLEQQKQLTDSLAARDAELKAARDELAASTEYAQHMAVLTSKNADPARVEASIRAVYGKSGQYTAEEIDAMIQTYQGTPEDQKGDDDVPEDSKPDPEIEAIKKQLNEQQRDAIEQEQRRVVTLVTSKAEAIVENDPGIQTLLKTVEQRWGEGTKEGQKAVASVKEQMLSDAKRRLASGLKTRRDQEALSTGARGAWNDAWVDEATAAVSQGVADAFRPGIGEPSSLGRSSETDADALGLGVDPEMLKEPEYSGQTVGEVGDEVRGWATNQLLDAMANEGSDATKV